MTNKYLSSAKFVSVLCAISREVGLCQTMELQVFKFKDEARLPTRATPLSAGLDLFALADIKIAPWSTVTVDTGIGLDLPRRTYGRIAPRSGLAKKHAIHVLGGVIDRDYHGPVIIMLQNLSGLECYLRKENAVAQLILERYCAAKVLEIKFSECVSQRGTSGFGSTDVPNEELEAVVITGKYKIL